MRQSLLLCVAAMTSLLVGCSTLAPVHGSWADNQLRYAGLNPFLLFDRFPGNTFATGVTPRAPWPIAQTGISIQEQVYFREIFEDRQGANRRSDNTFHRRFTTRRVGIIER